MTQPQSDHELRWKINGNLRQAIFEDSEDDSATDLLYNLVYGLTSTKLAASDISSLIRRSEDPDTIISSLTTQIVFLASEYAFLQPQLILLIDSVLSDPDFPEVSIALFSSQLVTTISDTAASNYAHLFERHNRTRNLVEDHVNLHSFLARLLSHGDLVGLDNTLYILSVGLENHLESHQDADIDVRAAAQYAIHAAAPIFDACVKGVGQELAATSPLFATRGRDWTGSAGLSGERWGFWKTKFATVEMCAATEETKMAARTAIRSMILVDGMALEG